MTDKSNDSLDPFRKTQLDVAAVVIGDMGHLVPMARIVAGIAAKGHNIVFYTFDYATVPANKLFDRLIGTDHKVCVEGIPCYAEWMAELKIDKINNNDEFHNALKACKHAQGEFCVFETEKLMYPTLKECFEKNRPSVILSDYLCLASMKLAEDMRIPHCVNAPISIRFASTFAGLTGIMREPLLWAGFKLNIAKIGTFRDLCKRSMERSIVFIMSFYGFEPGYEQFRLPPNFKVLGPVVQVIDANTCKSSIKAHDTILDQWLQQNMEENVPTVLISTGSMVRLERFQVKALYEGCVKAGVRVVWSLKQDVIDNVIPLVLEEVSISEEDHKKNFHISSWIPQSDLLQHPAINVAIIHGGWGGVLECVMAGKPMLTIPFFGDQPGNASLIACSGAGKNLCTPPKPEMQPLNVYKEGSLRSDTVCSRIREVIGDESFTIKSRKLQKCAQATLGVSEAVNWVELAGRYGVEHLTGVAT